MKEKIYGLSMQEVEEKRRKGDGLGRRIPDEQIVSSI